MLVPVAVMKTLDFKAELHRLIGVITVDMPVFYVQSTWSLLTSLIALLFHPLLFISFCPVSYLFIFLCSIPPFLCPSPFLSVNTKEGTHASFKSSTLSGAIKHYQTCTHPHKHGVV